MGKITSRRVIGADNVVRISDYKIVKVRSERGTSTTVCLRIDVAYALMRRFGISMDDLTRVLQDGARLMAGAPRESWPAHESWSRAVRARAVRLLQAMTAEARLAEENNSAWDEE